MIGWRHIFVMNEHTLHIQCIFWRLITQSGRQKHQGICELAKQCKWPFFLLLFFLFCCRFSSSGHSGVKTFLKSHLNFHIFIKCLFVPISCVSSKRLILNEKQSRNSIPLILHDMYIFCFERDICREIISIFLRFDDKF